MNKVTFKLSESDLSSEESASWMREVVRGHMKRGDINIVLNLSSVKSLSKEYADELFGVLTAEYGLLKVLRSIKILGATQFTLTTIATSMGAMDANNVDGLEDILNASLKFVGGWG